MDKHHLDKSEWLLEEEEIATLEEVGSTLRRGDGHVFMREGEAGDFLLLIKKGYVKVITGQPARIVAFRGPGKTVGELGVLDLLDGEPELRSATVIAWGEVEVLHVPAAELKRFLDENRRAERALHAAVRKRLTQATRQIPESDLAMERRTAKALTNLVQDGICEIVDGTPTIPFGQRDLASLTGASFEATKKIVAVFRRLGFIDTERLQIHVINADALRQIADGKPTSSW